MIRYAPLIDAFGRQATYGARRWFGRVGNRFAGIDLLGAGEGGGVLKAYYASGREIPEFDSTGARNWKYHSSDRGTLTGPPELIPGLSGYRKEGESWVEWLLPAELTEGSDEPEPILWIIWGLKVHDYTFSGGLLVQGAKIVSANNALVALFIATQRMELPPTRFHKWGQSWIDFKDRCAGTITFAAGTGLLGQYYSDATLTTLVHTRNEPYLDRDWDYVSPAPDVPAAPFSARFTGKVKPTHTGAWTFYARYDDGCRLWVNGVQLVDDWAAGAMRESSGAISLTADDEYDIVVEYRQDESFGGLHLSWSHASVPKEIVPQSRLIPPSRAVERYNAHVVFPADTPALVAFNSVFRRAPGCTWQDVNGALRVISTPDRPVTHKFVYDPTQTALLSNVKDASFSLKPRSAEDRPDYLIVSYSDLEDPFFTERTVAADRRVDTTRPPLNPIGPIPVGVATHSLASRIAETEMNVIGALSSLVRLESFADSHKVARGDVAEYSHDVAGVRETAPTKIFITEERFLSPTRTADDRAFVGRLHDPNWYSDSGYVPMSARIVSDIPSPYVPPPPAASVTLLKFDRFLPDDTHVPFVQGLVEFAAFAHPQRARVYWKRPRKAFTFDPATDAFTATAHGLPNGTKVELFNAGGSLPAGFSAATAYYVVNQAQNTFQLSLVPGGAAVNGTSAGSGTNEVREFDFAATNITFPADKDTLQGTFEVENVPLGVNDFKVVTESLKGVTRGVAAAAVYTFNVLPLPLPSQAAGLAVAGVSRAGVRLTWSANPETDIVAYRVERLNAGTGLWDVITARVDALTFTDPAPPTFPVSYRVSAIARGSRVGPASATATVTSSVYGTTAPVATNFAAEKGVDRATFSASPPAGMTADGLSSIRRVKVKVRIVFLAGGTNDTFYHFDADLGGTRVAVPVPKFLSTYDSIDFYASYEFVGGFTGDETFAGSIGSVTAHSLTSEYLPAASLSAAGIVTTASQTFAGDKTFDGSVVVGGGLTVDGGTLKVDQTNDRVGVGTAAPAQKLHVEGAGDVKALVRTTGAPGAGFASFTVQSTGAANSPYFEFQLVASSASDAANYVRYNFVGAGVVASMLTLNGAGGVGVGKVAAAGVELDVLGDIAASGSITGASKSFLIDHPNPNLAREKFLRYTAAETHRLDVYVRGSAALKNGRVRVDLDKIARQSEGTLAYLARDFQPFAWNASEPGDPFEWEQVRCKLEGATLVIYARDPLSSFKVGFVVWGERHDPQILADPITDGDGRLIVEYDKPELGAERIAQLLAPEVIEIEAEGEAPERAEDVRVGELAHARGHLLHPEARGERHPTRRVTVRTVRRREDKKE
jgi:hypothetical protein